MAAENSTLALGSWLHPIALTLWLATVAKPSLVAVSLSVATRPQAAVRKLTAGIKREMPAAEAQKLIGEVAQGRKQDRRDAAALYKMEPEVNTSGDGQASQEEREQKIAAVAPHNNPVYETKRTRQSPNDPSPRAAVSATAPSRKAKPSNAASIGKRDFFDTVGDASDSDDGDAGGEVTM